MKTLQSKTIVALALSSSLLASTAFGQVTEEFETDGDNGARYLSSTFVDVNDYFARHNYAAANPHPSQTNQTLLSVGGANHSEWAFAMEDITDIPNPLATESVLRLNDIAVGPAASNIQVTVSVAAIYDTSGAQPDIYAINEPLQVQYAFGANGGGTAGTANPTLLAGTYTTIGQFAGTGVIGAGPSQDADFNGTGDGISVLTNRLQDFTFSIPAPGINTTLSVQIRAVDLDGSDEYVFDNIRVTGMPLPVELISFEVE